MLFGDLNIYSKRGKIVAKLFANLDSIRNSLQNSDFILVLERPFNLQRSARRDVLTVIRSADRLLQSTPITQLLNNITNANCSTICNQPYLQ